MTLQRTIVANLSKSHVEYLQLLLDKLQKIQKGLSREYQNEYSLYDQVLNIYRGVEEYSLALYKPAPTFEGVYTELRSVIATIVQSKESSAYYT